MTTAILCLVTLAGMVVCPRFTVAMLLFHIGHPILGIITIVWAIIWGTIKLAT